MKNNIPTRTAPNVTTPAGGQMYALTIASPGGNSKAGIAKFPAGNAILKKKLVRTQSFSIPSRCQPTAPGATTTSTAPSSNRTVSPTVNGATASPPAGNRLTLTIIKPVFLYRAGTGKFNVMPATSRNYLKTTLYEQNIKYRDSNAKIVTPPDNGSGGLSTAGPEPPRGKPAH